MPLTLILTTLLGLEAITLNPQEGPRTVHTRVLIDDHFDAVNTILAMQADGVRIRMFWTAHDKEQINWLILASIPMLDLETALSFPGVYTAARLPKNLIYDRVK